MSFPFTAAVVLASALAANDPLLNHAFDAAATQTAPRLEMDFGSAHRRHPIRALLETTDSADLDAAMRALLDRVALSTSREVEAVPNRVNLLTLHATKGLEFSRVYVIGVEDNEMPGSALQQNRLSDIEEARRLLYVGMTRAKDRLVLTWARSRRGVLNTGTKFLDEINRGVE